MTLDTFITPRLHAERLLPDHLAEVRRMHRDARVMAELGGVRTEEQTQEYLQRNLDHWERYGFGIWIMRNAGRDTIVGRACVRHLDLEGRPEVEIGYALYPEFWGQGLGTEIANKCVAIGRRELGLDSLVAITRPTNRGSRRVMEKAGMVYEGETLHAGETHVVYRTASLDPTKQRRAETTQGR